MDSSSTWTCLLACVSTSTHESQLPLLLQISLADVADRMADAAVAADATAAAATAASAARAA